MEAFLNTVDRHTFGAHGDKPAGRRELLSTPDRLRAWLLARQGRDHDPGELEGARELLGRLHLCVGLSAEAATLEPTGGPFTAALERLAADLATGASTGALRRLKICGAPDCGFVYYDRSRSRTSRWCSTEVCGNRMKTRRYRHRRRG